jgi:hypothetical protein
MELVRSLTPTSISGDQGESGAADFAESRFKKEGLSVERYAVIGSRFPRSVVPWLVWVGAALLASLTVIEGVRGASTFAERAPIVISTLLLLYYESGGFRHGWGIPPRVVSSNVVAFRPSEPLPAVRVVFLAPLGAIAPVRAQPRLWWAVGATADLLATTLFAMTFRFELEWWTHTVVSDVARWSVLGLLWAAAISYAWWESRTPPGSGCSDNASGLAVLFELARTWSRGSDERIEARFVAAGGQVDDFAGSRALVRAIRNEWPRKPTLVIMLAAPADGRGLLLAANRQKELAGGAATDLWIPHRVVDTPQFLVTFWPFRLQYRDFVGLVGYEGIYRTRERKIEPEALARSAQLATELALRWAKRFPRHEESLARSSQNAG